MSDEWVVEAILNAVANREGVPEEELPPLVDYVDPDAIEAIVRHARTTDRADVLIQFQYLEYTITVAGSGEWSITDA